MRYEGRFRFESEPEASETPGAVEFADSRGRLIVGETEVASLPVQDLLASAIGAGVFRLQVSGEDLLFRPDDPDGFTREQAVITYLRRLNPSPSPPNTPAVVPSPMPAPQSSLPPNVIATRQMQTVNPPKNPGVAAVLSFLWPGLGQVYNGQGGKAAAFIVGQIVNLLLTFVVIGFFTGFVVWIWAIVDAYQGSEAYNRNRLLFPSQ